MKVKIKEVAVSVAFVCILLFVVEFIGGDGECPDHIVADRDGSILERQDPNARSGISEPNENEPSEREKEILAGIEDLKEYVDPNETNQLINNK